MKAVAVLVFIIFGLFFFELGLAWDHWFWATKNRDVFFGLAQPCGYFFLSGLGALCFTVAIGLTFPGLLRSKDATSEEQPPMKNC